MVVTDSGAKVVEAGKLPQLVDQNSRSRACFSHRVP
jgi:hypothetical protein